MPREGRGGTVLVSDRRLFDQLFYAQAGYFAAPAPARGKSYHQDSPIPQGGEILAGAGCQQLAQNVAGNGIGTLVTAWPVQGAHRKPDGRFNGRGRERSLQAAPAGQRRPIGKTTVDGCQCMRSGYAQKALSAQFIFHADWHAVTGLDLALLWPPQMMRDEFQQQGCRLRPLTRFRDRPDPRSLRAGWHNIGDGRCLQHILRHR